MAVMALLAYATNVKAENVQLLTDQQVDGNVSTTDIPSSHQLYEEADAGFYLVGDFMSPNNLSDVNPGGDIPGKINYERLYP